MGSIHEKNAKKSRDTATLTAVCLIIDLNVLKETNFTQISYRTSCSISQTTKQAKLIWRVAEMLSTTSSTFYYNSKEIQTCI